MPFTHDIIFASHYAPILIANKIFTEMIERTDYDAPEEEKPKIEAGRTKILKTCEDLTAIMSDDNKKEDWGIALFDWLQYMRNMEATPDRLKFFFEHIQRKNEIDAGPHLELTKKVIYEAYPVIWKFVLELKKLRHGTEVGVKTYNVSAVGKECRGFKLLYSEEALTEPFSQEGDVRYNIPVAHIFNPPAPGDEDPTAMD